MPIPLLETKRAAQYLGFHPNTLVKMRIRGDGPPFIRLGRSIRYRQRDLDLYIEKRLYRNTALHGVKPDA
ncbi:helix-turn-helix domain-containing protein [Ferrovibrio sp.]|uniref:helix-turn-helix domain-containing protein n=1 Tax=Ferrovibrio sp. TaxID=1917215 RepID=UPI0035303C4E